MSKVKKELAASVSRQLNIKTWSQGRLADSANVSQSTVSRALKGKWVRYEGTIKTLATYLGVVEENPDPRSSKLLMDALSEVWDGTKEGEKSLADVLYAIKKLR